MFSTFSSNFLPKKEKYTLDGMHKSKQIMNENSFLYEVFL